MIFAIETVLYHYTTIGFDMWECLSSKNLVLCRGYQSLLELCEEDVGSPIAS